MAKVVVVGAGVVGAATAWRLCKAGHEVTLVDRHDGPCGGASQRNGAQLSYSYCDALASPGLLARMPAILMGCDPAFRVRLQADPGFLLWSLRFVLNATPAAFRRNTAALLTLAAVTETLMPELLAEFPVAFDHVVAGKLVLCRDAASLESARAVVAMKRALGIEVAVIDRAEAERVEPALTGYADAFVGAIHSPRDAVGSPPKFCAGLIDGLMARHGLRTRYRAEATQLMRRGSRVTGVAFRSGETEACDGIVLATGQDTTLSGGLRALGAIWPVQGYSLTARATSGSMRVSVTDPSRRLVFARLGGEVRVAGIADIGRRGFSFDQARYESLKRTATAAFPDGFDLTGAEGWSGARPCTPSSRPVIGRGRVSGLYLNLGHGTLGWTLCLGAAERLAALVAKDLA